MISETDYEYKIDEVNHTEKNIEKCKLYDFITENKSIQRKAKSKDTNVIILDFKSNMYGFMLSLNKTNQSTFFTLLENYRRSISSDVDLGINEKQMATASGIMIDLDIYQISETELTSSLIKLAIKFIYKKIVDLFTHDEDNDNIVFAITRRESIKYDAAKEAYKNGIHILIPGVYLNKLNKKRLVESIMCNEFIDIFKGLELHSDYINDLVDTASTRVPVFFVGFPSKLKTKPYKLYKIYNVFMDKKSEVKTKNITDKFDNLNICFELSLNFSYPNSFIKPIVYKSKDETYENDILADQKDNKQIPQTDENYCLSDEQEMYNNLSVLKMHLPDSETTFNLLKMLPVEYSDKYDTWRAVMCALATENEANKHLAEYFSRKSPKFIKQKFEEDWIKIRNYVSTNPYSKGVIINMCKDVDEEKTKEIRNESISKIISDKLFSWPNNGYLGHHDFAQLLFMLFKDKFACTHENEKLIWYEFILPSDKDTKPNEIYKWRKYGASVSCPNLMNIYISTHLQVRLSIINNSLKQRMAEIKDDAQIAFYSNIIDNLQQCSRSLSNSSFKYGIIKECYSYFHNYNLTNLMDSNPLMMGVSNGVLKLGREVSLITGNHGQYIHRHTEVKYVPFNPHNPKIKLLLRTIKNCFPDDEHDAFMYIMTFLSSSLDMRDKLDILLMIGGNGKNGKSFLSELHNIVLGPYGDKISSDFLVSKSSGPENATTNKMKMLGKSYIYYSETDEGAILNMSNIKELTGGETISGRALYKDLMSFRLKVIHMLITNYFPLLNDHSHGGLRRLMSYTFKYEFVDTKDESKLSKFQKKANPNLSSWYNDVEMKEAYLSTIAWFYGKELWGKHNGIMRDVKSETIQNETIQYKHSQDNVSKFISTKLIVCPQNNNEDDINMDLEFNESQNIITLDSLITYYQNWCDSMSLSKTSKEQCRQKFLKSELENDFKTNDGVKYLKNIRVHRNKEAKLNPGEKWFSKNRKTIKQNKKTVTFDEWYDQIIYEWETEKTNSEEKTYNNSKSLYLNSIKNQGNKQIIHENINSLKESSKTLNIIKAMNKLKKHKKKTKKNSDENVSDEDMSDEGISDKDMSDEDISDEGISDEGVSDENDEESENDE